jgi:hypothetical protein
MGGTITANRFTAIKSHVSECEDRFSSSSCLMEIKLEWQLCCVFSAKIALFQLFAVVVAAVYVGYCRQPQ